MALSETAMRRRAVRLGSVPSVTGFTSWPMNTAAARGSLRVAARDGGHRFAALGQQAAQRLGHAAGAGDGDGSGSNSEA